MGLFDSVTDVLSGGGQSGYGDMQAEIQKAIAAINEKYGQGQAQMNPYAEAGKQAMGNYQNFYDQMSDPGAYYKKVMSEWEMSPAAQMNMKYGNKAMNQAAAAGGTVGTPGQQMQIGRFMNELVNTDQQNYLQNQLGIGDKYGNAQGTLMNQGFNAGNALMNSYMNQGNMLANAYGSNGQAQLQQQMARGGGVNDFLGMAGNAFMGSGTGKQFANWWGS